MEAKVTVVVPVYNVSAYLRKCLDSLTGQTLPEIEILCVDDGSTDDSPRILQEYAKKDPRVRILSGPNGGYGKAMNRGIDAARGLYIGIVEPDDYVDERMFEDLYICASENDLDLVKSDFYRFVTLPSGEEKLTYEKTDPAGKVYGRLLCPAEDPSLLRLMLNTWTGIYKKAFLDQYSIRHHETPGASFQDNGFFFQTFVHARRAMVLDKAYYKNRRDNPGSSIKSTQKVYCMNQEYDFIRDRLMEDPALWERFKYMYWRVKYQNYMFTVDRIDASYRQEYLARMQAEFHRAMQKGELNPEAFTEIEWKKVEALIKNAGGLFGRIRSTRIVRKLHPFIPEWAKRMVFRVLSRRK